MIYFKKPQQNGFSLVETLVAISILLIVIVGPMTISSRAAKSSTFATEQVQAFFLAQEGLELAQKIRDDFLLAYFPGDLGMSWEAFTVANSDCFANVGCGLTWADGNEALNQPVPCDASSCRLYISANPSRTKARSQFTHAETNNTPTPFTRTINFTETSDGGVRVVSTVTWRTGSLIESQKVEIDTYLYNIYATP